MSVSARVMYVGSAEARALEVKIDGLQDRYQAIIDSELSWQRRARPPPAMTA